MGTGGTQKDIIGDSSRLIFVGGKGGVGKTTTAAALALSLAGKRDEEMRSTQKHGQWYFGMKAHAGKHIYVEEEVDFGNVNMRERVSE